MPLAPTRASTPPPPPSRRYGSPSLRLLSHDSPPPPSISSPSSSCHHLIHPHHSRYHAPPPRQPSCHYSRRIELITIKYCPGVLGGDTGNESTYSLNKGSGVLGWDTCDRQWDITVKSEWKAMGQSCEIDQAPTPTVSSQQPLQVTVQDKGKGEMVEPEPVKKMSKKDLLRLNEELAFKLQVEEEEEEERLAREKAQ
ncbi:hypothetical protein Tco_0529800 [Tanacetum coccineum]